MNKAPILIAFLLLLIGCAASGKNNQAEVTPSEATPSTKQQKAAAYFDSAIESLEKAIEFYDDQPDQIYKAIMDIYFLRNEEEKAFEYALKIMLSRLDPEEMEERSEEIAEVYYELKNWDKAIEYYKKAINLEPDDKDLYNNMGFAYIKKQDWDKALECAQKIIDLSDSNSYSSPAYAWHIMAISYGGKKEYDKSLGYYEKSIEFFKSFYEYEADVIEMYNDMSNIYEAKGDKEKALDYKERAKSFKYQPRIFPPEKP